MMMNVDSSGTGIEFLTSMNNTFVIEQKQGQVNFHGNLQHEDCEIKDDIESPCMEEEGCSSSQWEPIDFRETS